MSECERVCERVRRECECKRRRAGCGRPAAPRSGSRTRGKSEQESRRPGSPRGQGQRRRSPPPALVPLLSFARGKLPVPPRSLCPAIPLDVPGALAGPPPALAASVGLVLRPPGVERAGSRGLRLPVLPRSPPLSPGPPTQLPGPGGCDNGL